jgi:hypothetical protein
MFILRISTVALLGMTAVTALAQAPSMNASKEMRAGLNNGDDHVSLPRSNNASNIVPADTTSNVVPTLPSPALSIDAGTRDFLRAARASLVAGHTGAAQQSLEMAETRSLGGGVSPGQAMMPNDSQRIIQIRDALRLLGGGDNTHAIRIIDFALAN